MSYITAIPLRAMRRLAYGTALRGFVTCESVTGHAIKSCA